MSQSIELSERLPFLEVSEDCIVSKRGDVTRIYELFKPELFSLSEEAVVTMHQAWVKAISLLPYGTVLHLQDWYTKASYDGRSDLADRSTLALSSERFFRGRSYRAHRCYLHVTRKFGSGKPTTSSLSSLLNRSLVPEFVLNPAQVQEFKSQCEQFIHVLTESGAIRSMELTNDELAGTEDNSGLIERYFQAGPPLWASELQDIRLDGGISIGYTPNLLYTLADAEHLPAECSPQTRYDRYSTDQTPYPIGFATPLGALLDVDHVYNQYILIDDPAPTLKKLETRQRRLRSLAGNSRENAVTHDAITRYLEQAALAGQRPVKAHYNIQAWPDERKGMADLKNKVVAGIAKLGAAPHLETVGAPQIWWSGIPGNAADLPVNETFDTFVEQAVCFFIPESNARNSPSPFGIRLGERQTGIPLRVDISDEPMRTGKVTNRNKFIVGGSGSGKSFFTNHLVRSYHEQGAHIVLVDVGGSYKVLCELLGGKYFAYSEEHPISFNPFYLPREEVMGTEKKESIKALLLTLWKKSEENYTRAEYIALSNLLEGYFTYQADKKGHFPCFDGFYEWVKEFCASGTGAREKEFDSANFLYVLKPYYKGGEYDWLLNAREENNLLDQRMIVFELDEIKDHPILFPVVTIVIMEVFINKMRKLKGVRKVILIEEAWKAIAKEGMSEYMRYLFKTVRKFFGEAIVVTQEVEDIISSPVVKHTILNQSDCKILLDMSKFKNRFGQLQELLGLTEMDKTMVLSLNKANEPGKKYKEVFIGLGTSHSRVYRMEVSLEEYLVYTTEESERVKVNEYVEQRGGIWEGVKLLADDIRKGTVKLLMAAVISCAFLLAPNGHASGQIIDIVDEAIKEALEQADLAVQRVQTQTIALQDAEKELENKMTGGLLDEITAWVQDEEDLYSEYYQELWQVKTALTTYSKVEQLIQRQIQLVEGYQQATAAVRQDAHFSAAELQSILNVYSGILNESIRNTGELASVIKAFVTQMDDAGRLRIIDETAERIDRNYTDLQEYTQENTLLSLQRAKAEGDLATIKTLYGIP